MNPTVKEPKKRFMTLKRREACLGWLFVSPALIGFSIFTFGSILYSFYLSMTDYDLVSTPKWVGFDNYIRAFTKDQYFYKYFGNTLYFVVTLVPIVLALSLLLAILINKKTSWVNNIYRVALFLPSITSTVAVSMVLLFDLSGHIHGFSKTQGTNAIFINPDAAADAVCGGISDCLQQAGIRDTDLNEICLFIPGFKNSANAVRDRFPKTRLMVLGDEYNAYYGALGEPGGIAVLSGTGSFAVCRDKKGSWISVGGWGPLFGDKGSGYHMGLMCLDRITQQWDRGSTNTLLQTLALKQLHMESIPSLRQGAYKPDFTREKIAKLSYTVAEAAKAGDIDALGILDEASVCLADLAAAVARRVGNDELPVSLLGGTSHMGDIFTKRFESALKEKLPQCSYRKPMFEPIVGAALFVMYEIVGRMDSREDFLKNIQAEWGTTYVNG